MPVLLFFSDRVAMKGDTAQMLQRSDYFDVGQHLKLVGVQVYHVEVCKLAENVRDLREKIA